MEHPEARNLSTTPMQDIYTGSILNELLQELRTATVAFLTDRYYDGTYVATSDDITELQEATAAVLADLADSGVFYGDNGCSGLLLPGERFLLPIPVAVDRVRCADEALTKNANLGDKSLNDTVVKDLGATETRDILPYETKPTELDGHRRPPQEHRHVALAGLLHQPDGINEVQNMYEDADSDQSEDILDTASDNAGLAFDASDALSRFQASNAASFFDLVAGAMVPYVSFDQLLEIDDGYTQLAHVQHVPEHDVARPADRFEDEIDELVDLWVLVDEDNTRMDIDGIDAVCSQFPLPPTTPFTQHREPKTIEPCIAALSYSTKLADHWGSVESSELRQKKLLDKEKKILLGQADAGGLDGFFADDVWTNTPNLDLALPASRPAIIELVDGVRVS